MQGSAATEIPVEQSMAENATKASDTPCEITVHIEPAPLVGECTSNVQVEPWTEPPKHELTAEEKSDDALSAFTKACNDLCPLMSETDLKQARVYFMEQRWRPRGAQKKVA
jgi:hypothetical protein